MYSELFRFFTFSQPSVFIGLIAVIQTISPTREHLIVEFTPQGLPGLQDVQQQANKSDTKAVAALFFFFPPLTGVCVLARTAAKEALARRVTLPGFYLFIFLPALHS